MKKLLASLLAVAMLLVYACQKENSFENGGIPSDGTLQSDVNGDCLPKNVVGAYVQGKALNGDSNYIEVTVDVATAGSYTIFSDTVNGVFFKSTGIFTATGPQVVKVRGGSATPANEGTFNFTIQYDSTFCTVPVTFLPVGSGGPAVFTLNGAGGDCTGAQVAGTYAIGVALTSSNTVTINVNVTTIGTYNITATGGGMTFTANSAFSATGPQTVTLVGSGTPTTGGNNVIPITVGTASCNFTVTVGAAAVGTLGGGPGACTPSTVNGTYTTGTALTATNTVQVQVNITTPGAYSITTNTVNGISFSASGNFAANGTQNVTLNGTGTPTNSGTFNFTVTFGTSTCTFSVTVVAGVIDYFPRTTNSNWSYEITDDPIDSVYRKVIAQTHSAGGNTYNIFMADVGAGLDSSGYYRKAGTDYYEWIDMGGFIGYDNPMWVEYIFLKDAAAGTNWKSAGYTGTVTIPPNPPQSLTIRFSYTILQKDVPITFTTSTGTMNFNNVIVVQEKYEQEVTPGNWQDITSIVGYGKAYYARGIGFIKYEVFDPGGTLADYQEVRRHQVF